jgi:uncharacterized membrane protein
VKQKIILISIAVILSLPIAAYMFQFGWGFWNESSEWSELGSYIGGIYAPILTLLTLAVLCFQFYLQVLQHRQHLVSLQEQELSEYMRELNLELDKPIENGCSLRIFLLKTLNDKNIHEISQTELDIIFGLNQTNHKLYSMWCGVMECLQYIEIHSKIKNFESVHYLMQKNKVIAYMSPQICSSLDKYNYSLNLILEQLTGQKQVEVAYKFWVNKEKA